MFLDLKILNFFFQVGQGRMCLWCNEKSKRFRTLDAVRKHMSAKGHCKIAFSGGNAIAEFADFYDYSKTYPEGDEEENKDPDMEVDVHTLDDTGYELVLPSGAKVCLQLDSTSFSQLF